MNSNIRFILLLLVSVFTVKMHSMKKLNNKNKTDEYSKVLLSKKHPQKKLPPLTNCVK